MAYRVDIGNNARRQIDGFLEHLRRFSFETADKYERALQQAIDTYLVNSPTTFGPYWETGLPYQGFLFTVSPRTSYWVVYRVYESEGLVRVLRFQSASQETGTHGL
jgi:plasmid stabilization system protein ParE